jgi:PAS domain S-box-containing protein
MSEIPLTARERQLTAELERLHEMLDEPVQTVEAIRRGEVDAFVVAGPADDDHVYLLKSADRLHRLIVEAMGEGAVTLSHGGAITYCNPNFLQLIGRDRSELLGHHFHDFITPETREIFDTILRGTDGAPVRAEVELISSDGPIPITVSATLLREGDLSDYCVIVNDLRDQRAREQLRAAKEAAELANRAKDDFLAMVSHELRSPITVILGWTRMLQMNRVDRDTLSLGVDHIHNSTARLLKLVEDILDASRLSSGKVTLQSDVLDLRECVQASIDAVRFDVDQKPLQVSVSMPEGPVFVRGDHERLQQVGVNLLVNAVKFTPPHGRIDVTLEQTGGHARLRVRDTGEGIDEAFLPFIFERFRQDDGSTTRAHKGLGLGLAIVKQLVEAHGGSVSAESEGKGRGACLTVVLPIAAEERTRTASAIDSTPLPSLESKRVLIVDDEHETVDVLRTILLSAGASVEAATTVAHALELAATFQPHVILSDIAMPGEDGFQFIRRLDVRESDHAAVPVLAMTGKTAPAERDAILAAGFHGYLRKPIEPAELIRAIAAAVSGGTLH